MTSRSKRVRSRVYLRNQGGERRAYGDFRDGGTPLCLQGGAIVLVRGDGRCYVQGGHVDRVRERLAAVLPTKHPSRSRLRRATRRTSAPIDST